MQLTGKANDAFENWYITVRLKHGDNYFNSNDSVTVEYKRKDLKAFEIKHPSEKYGVYVDFADSVGVSLFMYSHFVNDSQYYYEWAILVGKHFVKRQCEGTRPEARTAAIEKLDQILNERL